MNRIVKCAGVMIIDRRVLVVQSAAGWVAPGGKLERGEDDQTCLVRELAEELGIVVEGEDLRYWKSFEAEAHGKPGVWVIMRVYMVEQWRGVAKPQGEVVDILWVTASEAQLLPLGSIMKTQVVPDLQKSGLID